MKVHTDELELVASRLQSTTAKAASLLTTDATLSTSGTVSVYAAAVDALLDNDASIQSEGDVALRSRRVGIDTQNAASVHTQGALEAQTQRMRVRAGAQQAGGKVTVALDCAEMPELCDAVRSEHGVENFAADAAEMLGISRQRLVVHSQPAEQTGRRRVQTKPLADTDGHRRRANTAGDSGGDAVGSSARRQPRSHKRLRELHKWSIGELEKWLRNVQKMPAVARAVGAERVDGRMAIEMGAEDWQELGATSSQGARLAETIQDILRLGGLPKREME